MIMWKGHSPLWWLVSALFALLALGFMPSAGGAWLFGLFS